MIFADDEREANPTSFKFLQMAHEWAQKAKKSGVAPSAVLPTLATSRSTQESAKSNEEESRMQQDEDDSASDVASSQGGDD